MADIPTTERANQKTHFPTFFNLFIVSPLCDLTFHESHRENRPPSLSAPLGVLSQALPFSGSIAVCKSTRPHLIRCAVLAVAKIVESRPADGLVGACGPVLPAAERRPANGVGRAAQAGGGAGIGIGAPYTVSRRVRSITEIIKIGFANRLSRPAELIEVVEGRVADVGAGTTLGLSQ